ncbi:hypothetical protein AAHC03_013550 [Spirometra sp. Aus1]
MRWNFNLSVSPAPVRSPRFGGSPGVYNINTDALPSTQISTWKATMRALVFFLLALTLTVQTLEHPYRNSEEEEFDMQGEDDHFLPHPHNHDDPLRNREDDDIHSIH